MVKEEPKWDSEFSYGNGDGNGFRFDYEEEV